MTLLAKYNLKSLLRRKAATVSTALSFALAVAVFVVLMGLAKGVLDVHHRAGNERNIVVLQKGASDAHFSSLSSEDLHKIRYREFVARTVDGRESVSPELELVSWVTLPQVAGKRHTNLRGVTAAAVDLHGIQLEQGRLFRGSSEAILGQTAAKRFGLRPGDKFHRGRSDVHGHGDLLLFRVRGRVGGLVRTGWADGGLRAEWRPRESTRAW